MELMVGSREILSSDTSGSLPFLTTVTYDTVTYDTPPSLSRLPARKTCGRHISLRAVRSTDRQRYFPRRGILRLIPSPGTGTGSSRTYRLPERAMRIPYRNTHTRSHDLPYDRPVLQSIALPVVFQDRGTGSVLQGRPTGTDPLPVLWLWKCKTHFRGAGQKNYFWLSLKFVFTA